MFQVFEISTRIKSIQCNHVNVHHKKREVRVDQDFGVKMLFDLVIFKSSGKDKSLRLDSKMLKARKWQSTLKKHQKHLNESTEALLSFLTLVGSIYTPFEKPKRDMVGTWNSDLLTLTNSWFSFGGPIPVCHFHQHIQQEYPVYLPNSRLVV